MRKNLTHAFHLLEKDLIVVKTKDFVGETGILAGLRGL
jgi:hypothetical protein